VANGTLLIEFKAIFSTRIVPDSEGLGTFGWLIEIFLVGTFIFALSLQTILGFTRIFLEKLLIGRLRPGKSRSLPLFRGLPSLSLGHQYPSSRVVILIRNCLRRAIWRVVLDVEPDKRLENCRRKTDDFQVQFISNQSFI
jgi:hypothetical protein